MKEKVEQIVRNLYYTTLSTLPTKANINFRYFINNGRLPNLKSPKKFSEKILFTMFDKEYENYNIYVDKYLVREEIKKLIGEKYLNKLIGVYDKVEEIDFEQLPNRFVLKVTNGSGCNIIVKDKKKLDINKCKKKLEKWLKINYYKVNREPEYKNVKSRIICEEYLEDESGELRDYKIFCFNGEPEFIQVDTNRFSGHKQDFYNIKWEKIDLKFVSENSDDILRKPKKLDEMLELSKKNS